METDFETFGFYRCDNSDIYTNAIKEMVCPLPGSLMGCEATPII